MARTCISLIAALMVLSAGSLAMALSAEEVLALKKAGVSDKTIQLMIQQEAAAKESGEKAGMREVRDKDGNAVITYSAGSRPRDLDRAEQEKVDKAWNMLQHTIIDGRK